MWTKISVFLDFTICGQSKIKTKFEYFIIKAELKK